MKHLTFLIFSIFSFAAASAQNLLGNAKATSGDEYSLTSDSSGSVMSGTKLNLNSGFDISFQVKFGASNGNGSEGLVFLLAKSGQIKLGAAGAGMGYEGIDSSIAVEFDTRGNGDSYDDPSHGNNSDHIAVRVNGSFSSAARISQNVLVDNLEDNNFHTVRFNFNGVTKQFDVYLDGSKKVSVTYDIREKVFGGDSTAFWGVSAATSNNFSVLVKTGASVLPVSLIAFHAEASENAVVLNWSTASEYNASHFEVLRSFDGVNWEVIETVSCAGTSNSIRKYSHTDYSANGRRAYYQLKQVDFDGKSEYFRVVAAGSAGEVPVQFYDMQGNKVFFGTKLSFLQYAETGRIYFSETGEKFQKM